MDFFLLMSLMIMSLIHNQLALPEDDTVTFDMLYSAGKESYNGKRWYECAVFMKRALADYKFYNEGVIECRLQCQKDYPGGETESELELTFFEIALRRSDCVRRCKLKRFEDRVDGPVNKEILEEFETLKPYDFLQICAYNSDRHEEAASAAYTFLIKNPKHEVMQDNVAFYQAMPEVKPSDFKNLETEPHQEHYSQAVDAYGSEDWSSAIKYMEEALYQYFEAFDRCTVQCEGQYDHESTPDFYNAIAGKQLEDHWISVLKCQKNCPEKLATWGASPVPNYLREHYNYLQFAYYKADDLKRAAQAVGTFQLFGADDETMKNNKEYYLDQPDISEEDFKPRKDTVAYSEKLSKLAHMYDFITKDYKFSEADEDVNASESSDEKEISVEMEVLPAAAGPKQVDKTSDIETKSSLPDHIFGPRDENFLKELEEYKKSSGIKIFMEGPALGGHNRVAIDDLLTQEQCDSLIDLASSGSQGDGYKGSEERSSPHTEFERFEGLTVSTAAELVEEGVVPKKQASLYLQASENGRAFLEKYYNLNSPLYFHYTHLVCRTALQGKNQNERQDVSHPVHADNCYIQQDGSCLKEPPAYVFRDFSALIYLNDDFEGGDFFFAHKNLSIQNKVRPKCGRMVGFEASNYHGVEAVTKGRRCAVAIWFTMDPSFKETAHQEADSFLTNFVGKTRTYANPKLQGMLDKNGYSIAMTEKELKGPDRFVADGVADLKSCKILRSLANAHAKVGDGYELKNKKRLSPHTEHEKFAGLSVGEAAQQHGTLESAAVHTSGQEDSLTDNQVSEGLTVLRAAQLAAGYDVPKESVQAYLDLSQRALELVKAYFNIKTPLYFDYTHLVCRTALDGTYLDREDLSHPVHADNCLKQEDGSCKKERPAYTQRDYSALLYLNDDFVGGDFFFAHGDETEQSRLRPRCGRLVAFNNTNHHGASPVTEGQRCAVVMWYTLNPTYKEAAHGIAEKLMADLEKPAGPPAEDDVDHGEL